MKGSHLSEVHERREKPWLSFRSITLKLNQCAIHIGEKHSWWWWGQAESKSKSKSKSNQIKCLSSITWGVVAPSPEPEAHVLSDWAFRVELEFRSAGFWGEGKTRVPGGKPLGAEKEPTTNLAHIWSELRIEPGPHRLEASALTTVPALLPQNVWICGQHAQLGVFRDGLWSSYLTYIIEPVWPHAPSLSSCCIPLVIWFTLFWGVLIIEFVKTHWSSWWLDPIWILFHPFLFYCLFPDPVQGDGPNKIIFILFI